MTGLSDVSIPFAVFCFAVSILFFSYYYYSIKKGRTLFFFGFVTREKSPNKFRTGVNITLLEAVLALIFGISFCIIYILEFGIG